jgi:ABC-type cobalamin transport system permease subunit
MSPTGALVVALIALVLLGSLAAWLVNVPVWAIGTFAVLGGLLARRVFLRLSRGRARQNTEARPPDA